jgi:hypothetical protein
MKPTVVSPGRFAVIGSSILALSLCLTIGCGDGGPIGSSDDIAKRAPGKYGPNNIRELAALKKANPKVKEFKKAIEKLKLEQMQADGVVIQTSPASKKFAKKGP